MINSLSEPCSIHQHEMDELGFIYLESKIVHHADGSTMLTLLGESMVSGRPISLTVDIRTIEADKFKELREGDFVEFESYTEGNA